MDVALGIDIGGTGMKAAPVEVSTGRLIADRFRIPTPTPSTPEAMAEVVREGTRHLSDDDLAAMLAWLRHIPPVENDPKP